MRIPNPGYAVLFVWGGYILAAIFLLTQGRWLEALGIFIAAYIPPFFVLTLDVWVAPPKDQSRK